MRADSVITLENDVNCLLLEKAVFEDNNYFMAVVLNEQDEPTDEYMVLKEIIEDNEQYVEKVEDNKVLTELVKLFTTKLDNFVDSLPQEEA